MLFRKKHKVKTLNFLAFVTLVAILIWCVGLPTVSGVFIIPWALAGIFFILWRISPSRKSKRKIKKKKEPSGQRIKRFI
jgi:uncharacterized membrane protein YciS (DUF1049 family)